jgi:orotidine-5'-phosphate decarboxylase
VPLDLSPRDRLAVALDVPGLTEAEALLGRLAGVPGWLKVGLELFVAAGPAALERAAKHGRVFLDAKLHDIPNTAAGAVAAATRQGIGMITLHVGGGREMLRAARAAADETAARSGLPAPLLLGVTVLTSLADADLATLGVAESVPDHVARLVDLAQACGLDGVVASAQEVAALRRRVGGDLVLVTPGIRPSGSSVDDQARVATPAEAIAAGADVLVVGRPITRAPDPAASARSALREIEAALAARKA